MLDAAAAERHPLFGMGGWLRLPSAGYVIVVGAVLFMLLGDQPPPFTPWRAQSPAGPVLDGLDLLMGLVLPAVAVLWFRRWRHFRIGYLCLAAVTTLAALADLILAARMDPVRHPETGAWPTPDMAEEVAFFVLFLAIDALFLVAMQRSRRFRVTFEHRVRAGEAATP
jgi:hypothetical protein